MALAKRLKNMTSYLHWSRLKAVFGLLSSDQKHRWVLTIGAEKLSEIKPSNIYPWYVFNAIDYIENLLTSEMKVLEYGSGYSTLWWAKRIAEVTCIERSKKWHEEVRLAISKNKLQNVKAIYFDKLPCIKNDNISEIHDPDKLDAVVNEYIFAANPSPASFDVVVVDDVFRDAVSKKAIEFVKPGGLFILDDSERTRHRPTIEMFSKLKWNFASFYGTPPYHFHEKQTTIWFKPLNDNS